MNALIVDDSLVMRRILSDAISPMGFKPHHANQGKTALTVLEKSGEEFSIILLDWNMPEMNGLEFLKAVRANPQWATIPVLMVTTEGNRSSILEAIKAGANGYLTKPFTTQDLQNRVINCMGMAC